MWVRGSHTCRAFGAVSYCSDGEQQVRYYTKLKTADPSRGREEEGGLEKICGYKGPDDSSPKLLVR